MYGIRLLDMPGAASLLHPAGPNWPPLAVKQRIGSGARVQAAWDDQQALLNVQGGGHVVITRDPLLAEFSMPGLRTDSELVHPFLAGTSALINWWAGRETFHAGAFLYRGKAWVVVGQKGAGKSSLLGYLASRGVPVLADDVVVLDGLTVLAGPACIDLRKDAAAELGVGEDLGVVGARERWRLTLPQAPSRAPLGGWITQEWHEETFVEAVGPLSRLMVIMPHLSLRRPRDASSLLPLTEVPCLLFARERGWGRLPAAVQVLLEGLDRLVGQS